MSQRVRHPLHASRRRSHRQFAPAALVAAALMATALVGCGNDNSDQPTNGARPSTSTEGDAAPGSTAPPNRDFATLCIALDAALAGDIDAARASFDHGPLHELADAAIDVDRATAARLLEAKEAVEGSLADTTLAADAVADDLRTLVEATIAALTATGEPTPELCEQETR